MAKPNEKGVASLVSPLFGANVLSVGLMVDGEVNVDGVPENENPPRRGVVSLDVVVGGLEIGCGWLVCALGKLNVTVGDLVVSVLLVCGLSICVEVVAATELVGNCIGVVIVELCVTFDSTVLETSFRLLF